MISQERRLGLLALLAVCLLGPTCVPVVVEHEVPFGDYTLRYVQSAARRVGRTFFEYDFAATLANEDAPSASVIVVEATSTSAATSVVNGRLRFPPVAAGSLALSADELTIRQDRTVPFDPSALQFVLSPPDAAPALAASVPSAGASNVPRTAWLRLDFAAALSPSALDGFVLVCNGLAHPTAAHAVEPSLVVIDPEGELPVSASCALIWVGPEGAATLEFSTAPHGAPANVFYDRTDRARTPPFPDDYWLVPDPATETGYRAAIAVPEREPDVQQLFSAMIEGTKSLDGFSPIGGISVELSDAPDPDSLPRSPEASLDPLASVGLFDLTPGSASYGDRVPFLLAVASVALEGQPLTHSLVLYPSIPLAWRGRYGLVVTNRVLCSPSRPFAPSAFFEAALAPAEPGENPSVAKVRTVAGEVLEALETQVSPPIQQEDVALALSIRIRSGGDIPNDLVAMKEQVLAAPAPGFTITDVTPGSGHVAAIVTGTWEAPDWREGAFLARDQNGDPRTTRTQALSFTLALPQAALEAPVPLIMYQHGGGGSAEGNIPYQASSYLAEAGFAVIGFTDVFTRELGPDQDTQNLTIFAVVLAANKPPDFWVQVNGEQLAFLRVIEQLGSLDVLPLAQPDESPDVDPSRPLTFVGHSAGAAISASFLPYAPEVRAAALLAGGMRQTEQFFHQDQNGSTTFFREGLPSVIRNITPPDIWVGISIYQMVFDRQDSHNHAGFLYRNPIEVAGTTRKPSVLIVEGVNDRSVPNNATRSLAWTIGPIPHLEPVQQAVPSLESISGPVAGNMGADTTAAYYQFVPQGVPGVPPTPGCWFDYDGHSCAQSSPESQLQRRIFFQTAVTNPAPIIVDPLE